MLFQHCTRQSSNKIVSLARPSWHRVDTISCVYLALSWADGQRNVARVNETSLSFRPVGSMYMSTKAVTGLATDVVCCAGEQSALSNYTGQACALVSALICKGWLTSGGDECGLHCNTQFVPQRRLNPGEAGQLTAKYALYAREPYGHAQSYRFCPRLRWQIRGKETIWGHLIVRL